MSVLLTTGIVITMFTLCAQDLRCVARCVGDRIRCFSCDPAEALLDLESLCGTIDASRTVQLDLEVNPGGV
jgi:hypothetical protein